MPEEHFTQAEATRHTPEENSVSATPPHTLEAPPRRPTEDGTPKAPPCTPAQAAQHLPEAQAARVRAFPRGLEQPHGAYRFGLDALLLAAWTADCLPRQTSAGVPVAELGTGCGAAAIGVALLRPDVHVCALEKEQPLAEAARANCAALGLADRIAVLREDLAEKDVLYAAGCGHFAAVLANPPWRTAQEGRPSPAFLRRQALSCTAHPKGGHGPQQHAAANTDAALTFALAARALLTHHGRYCCIFAAAGLPRLLAALAAARLGLRRLRFVHTLADRPAHAVLLEARKDARDDPRVEPPLLLHTDTHAAQAKEYTAQARAFCPWLG